MRRRTSTPRTWGGPLVGAGPDPPHVPEGPRDPPRGREPRASRGAGAEDHQVPELEAFPVLASVRDREGRGLVRAAGRGGPAVEGGPREGRGGGQGRPRPARPGDAECEVAREPHAHGGVAGHGGRGGGRSARGPRLGPRGIRPGGVAWGGWG